MSVLIFKDDFLDIPFQDMSGADYIVCLDPQERLGYETWSVIKVDDSGNYKDACGLFWCGDKAKLFAECLDEKGE